MSVAVARRPKIWDGHERAYLRLALTFPLVPACSGSADMFENGNLGLQTEPQVKGR